MILIPWYFLLIFAGLGGLIGYAVDDMLSEFHQSGEIDPFKLQKELKE